MNKLATPQEGELNDIRKIREANSQRHLTMTPVEIIADINGGAQKVLNELAKKKIQQNVF